ncbi:MAG: efflux RND transporter periplasmic adaptor subunit [Candidatus Hydrogenedentales bacterium]
MKRFIQIILGGLLPLGVLGGALFVAWSLFASEPEAERTNAERQPPLVQVVPLTPQPIARTIQAYGGVMPAREVGLSLEVSGRIEEIHPALQPGGLVQEGELLIRVNRDEYQLALERAEAALAEAVADLEVEQGRQRVAEREWELFGRDLPESELGRELALREPQMNQAKARIASARSAVERAELDLARTEIHAPFDAMVLTESVDIGQTVGVNDQVAMLVGTEAFWVQASVPASQIGVLAETSAEQLGAVRVYSDAYSRTTPVTRGRLLRMLGQVDMEGRMAQVLVEVPDPFVLDGDSERLPLPLNTYVRVEIDAGALESAVPIPHRGLRENGEVWIANARNELEAPVVDIIWSGDDLVAVRNTFNPGDRLIVSPLENALPGMDLRVRDADDAPEAAEALPLEDS